jgi:hypothetical protein
LHIPADCQKTFRVQLAVFKRIPPRTSKLDLDQKKVLHARSREFGEFGEDSPLDSDEEEEEAEPNTKKGQIITRAAAAAIDDYWNVGQNVNSFVLKEVIPQKEKKLIYLPLKNAPLVAAAPETTGPKSKKKQKKKILMDNLKKKYYYNPTNVATDNGHNNKEEEYFVYYKKSEYPLHLRAGFQVRQTEDQKRYYARLL